MDCNWEEKILMISLGSYQCISVSYYLFISHVRSTVFYIGMHRYRVSAQYHWLVLILILVLIRREPILATDTRLLHLQQCHGSCALTRHCVSMTMTKRPRLLSPHTNSWKIMWCGVCQIILDVHCSQQPQRPGHSKSTSFETEQRFQFRLFFY